MAKGVFANGREISAKKSDNIAISIPINVCHSPAPPPHMPKIDLLISYSNISKPSTLANASKTMKIKKQLINLENKSYYKRSNSNEPATTQVMADILYPIPLKANVMPHHGILMLKLKEKMKSGYWINLSIIRDKDI